MNEYTASNGLRVARHEKDYLGFAIYDGGINTLANSYSHLNSSEMQAPREFFRAEEDERLGRWRWPENPNYVVYPYTDDLVRVLNETSPGADAPAFSRSEETTSWMSSLAARAYFDAHPEPNPIPNEPRTAWVDKYGTDVWHVGTDGVLRCVLNPSSDPAKYAPFTRLVPEETE